MTERRPILLTALAVVEVAWGVQNLAVTLLGERAGTAPDGAVLMGAAGSAISIFLIVYGLLGMRRWLFIIVGADFVIWAWWMTASTWTLTSIVQALLYLGFGAAAMLYWRRMTWKPFDSGDEATS